VIGLAGGEHLTTAQIAGLALALAGLVLVSRRPAPAVALPAGAALAVDRPPTDFDRGRVIGLSLVNAAGYGVFLVAMRPASHASAAWAVFLSRASVVAGMLALGVAAGTFAGLHRLPPARLTLPGVLLFSGILAYAAATRHGTLVTVSVLGSLFPVVTVALAFTLDRERLSRAAGVGVAGVIAGVVLLSSG
jgi:drug/metabolite transporter (DMT)-like permease